MTAGSQGWRAVAGGAVAVASGDPKAWALGLLGFLARGGWLVLALPILSVPSPVLLSMLFRGEVGAMGRGDLHVVAVIVGLVLASLAIGGVLVSAYADVALAERFVRDAESEELRAGRAPRRLTAGERRSLVWWVASVQAIGLSPVILALTLVVDGAVRATTAELVGPSATDLPLVGRVLPAIAGRLGLLAAVVVVVEALSSLASRRLMAHAWGVAPGVPPDAREGRLALGALARVVRTPFRVAATALAGWLLMVVTVSVVLAASVLAWSAARDVLVMGRVGSDPVALAVASLLVVTFAAVWIGGLVLVGFASAVRSALWTADALRPGPEHAIR